MRVLVQRSDSASCTVNKAVTGSISKGLVLLVGFTAGDTIDTIKYLVNKIINLRIFDDENGIMNKSILEVENASILSISQFTLYADTKKGNRPSYRNALNGTDASKLYDLFNIELAKYITVATGVFGANMKINLINNGPVTIWLEKEEQNGK